MDVNDGADAIVKLLKSTQSTAWNRTYNLCNDRLVSIDEVAGSYVAWSEAHQISLEIEYLSDEVNGGFPDTDNRQLKESIDWTPRSPRSSIFELLDNYKRLMDA